MNRISKSISIFCFLMYCITSINAQVITMDTMIYPLTTKGQSFENYLVSLAWENNPEYKIHASKLNIAAKEIKLAKRDWADDWNITLNLNEINLRGSNIDTTRAKAISLLDRNDFGEASNDLRNLEQLLSANNFPRYNFGLSLNLGSLLTRGLEVDIAEQNLMIEQFTADQDKIEIRSEVYQAYTEYNQAIKILKIVAKQEQTSKDIFDLMKTRFKNGSIDFDKYNASSEGYNRSLESLITSEEKVNTARMTIESFIGIPLSLAKFYYDQNNGN